MEQHQSMENAQQSTTARLTHTQIQLEAADAASVTLVSQ
jgi:hypothetical protein